MDDEFGGCGAQAPLSDAEIAGVFRDAADENGLVGPVELLVIDGRCVIAGDHAEHADDLAIAGGRDDKLWLRWDSSGRRVLEWVACCPEDGECVLFAGHAGKCQWDFGEDGFFQEETPGAR